MKFFVTGVNGQLGHDVMNELNKRGHECVGSDIAPTYEGIADGSAVTIMHYVGLATKVTPVTTEEYGLSKAARPSNSRLDKSKLVENGFEPLPTWQDAV